MVVLLFGRMSTSQELQYRRTLARARRRVFSARALPPSFPSADERVLIHAGKNRIHFIYQSGTTRICY
jgi:hypothetical protein